MLTLEMLNKLWPQGDSKVPGLRAAIVNATSDVFARYGITTNGVIAQMMAQFSLECGAGTEMTENLSYSAQRAHEVWPSRFPTVESAEAYAHNPEALAAKVYNGRMGNRLGSTDGYNFRGRGLSQVTAVDGYTALGKKVGLDLLSHPDLVNDPKYVLECGVADFILCNCLEPAQKGDIKEVTHRLNGGYTDLAEREAWLAKWQAALSGTAEPATGAKPRPEPPQVPAAPKPAPAPTPAPTQGGKIGGAGATLASVMWVLHQVNVPPAVYLPLGIIAFVVALFLIVSKKA